MMALFPFRFRSAEVLTPYFDLATNPNLKAVDHVVGTPEIRQITSRRSSDVVVLEAWEGRCTVEVRATAQVPVCGLPVLEPLVGFCWRADFTLVPGEVIHDYLGGRA